ncbi:MAG: hypothetical protein M1838_002921 [Thelocarpon superellum]|nr:MAG: hypothetical protein M1838_002921 [Thelocarpon superellum]
MAPAAVVAARDNASSTVSGLTPMTVNLLIALFAFLFLGLLSLTGLLFLRSYRRSRANRLPAYEETTSCSSKHRRLTITAAPYGRYSQSIHVYNEKENLVEHSSSPPLSPATVPEIRITFPEEEGEGGRRTSGRVVLVRMGETGVGLEPLDESLPPYQSSDADRFHSLDLDRIGDMKSHA